MNNNPSPSIPTAPNPATAAESPSPQLECTASPAPKGTTTFWQNHRRSAVLTLAVLFALAVVGCLKSCSPLQRSPFSGILPADTPLVIEGSPQDVAHFLVQMDIAIPALGDGQDLSSLNCSRLLYAAIPPESNGDVSGCKKAIMKTVNILEENWTTTQSYPATLEGLAPNCPHGGTITYRLTDNGFALSCQGTDHQTTYDSVLGLSTDVTAQKPLVFIAFYSDDPCWDEAAISPQHPDLKILSSDPEFTAKYLEQVPAPLDIRYPKDSSMFVQVLNASLPQIWTKLPAELPGKYTTITKSAQTGIYSLRAQVAEPESETQSPSYPSIEKTLACLPQGQTRLAGSCALLESLNLLPLSPVQLRGGKPLTLGMATNATLRLAQLLPTFSSGLAGLTQSSFSAQFGDAGSAQNALRQSPWGDLSQPTNPQCTGTCNGAIAQVAIGDPLPAAQNQVALPPGPGPAQLGGVVTVTVSPQDVRPYAFSGGVHENQLWLEVQPLHPTSTHN